MRGELDVMCSGTRGWATFRRHETSPSPDPAAPLARLFLRPQVCRVVRIDLPQAFVWIGRDLLDARWTADVNDLTFHHRPLGTLRQFLLHDRASALRPGDVGVDRGPVLWVDLSLQAAFAAQKDLLLLFAHGHLNRRPH